MESFVGEACVVESSLLNRCFRIVFASLLLSRLWWNLSGGIFCCGIAFVVEFLLWHICCGRFVVEDFVVASFVVESLLCFVVESLVWNLSL